MSNHGISVLQTVFEKAHSLMLARAALCAVSLIVPLQESRAATAHVIVVDVDEPGDLGWNGIPLSSWAALEFMLQRTRHEIPPPRFVIRGEVGADAETKRVAGYLAKEGFKTKTILAWRRPSGR